MNLEICRICGEKTNLKFIVGAELLEKLQLCANIEINYEDNLPKYICQKCDHGLDFSYRLRKQSEQTQKKLRDELEKSSQAEVAPKNEMNMLEIEDKLIEESKSTFMLLGKVQMTVDTKVEEKPDSETYLDDIIDSTALEFVTNTVAASTLEDEVEENRVQEMLLEWHQKGQSYGKSNDKSITYAGHNMHEDVDVVEDFAKNVVQSNLYEDEETFSETETKNKSTNNLLEFRTEIFREPHENATENMQLEKNILGYECDTCHLVFNSQYDYRMHIKQHGKERYHCIQCNKWYASRFRFKQHERSHSDDIELYSCPYCTTTFRIRSSVNRHIRNVHEEKRNFTCSICNENFGRADVLKNHIASHTAEQNYVCQLCLRAFKCQRYLDSHVRTHHSKTEQNNRAKAKKKTYYCAYCGKVSKHHFTHKNHLRTHTQENPYPCERCEKNFRTMAALITHERVHTDTRPYQCEVCLASFRQRSHLKEHRLTHADVYPYVCHICQASFARKCNLKAHMRVHSGVKPYQCIRCEQYFTKLSSLKRHAANIHGNSAKLVGQMNENVVENNITLNNESNTDLSSNEYFANTTDTGVDAYDADDDYETEGIAVDKIAEPEQENQNIIEIDTDDDDDDEQQLEQEQEQEAVENNISDYITEIDSDDDVIITDLLPNDNTLETNIEVPNDEVNLLPSTDLNADNSCADISHSPDPSGIVLVIDDEDKFNSLFIMDDIMAS